MRAFAETNGTREAEFFRSGAKQNSQLETVSWSSVSAPTSNFQIQRSADCACGGDCPACQAKDSDLPVSHPSDASEIEADRVADLVMRSPTNKFENKESEPLSKNITPIVQTKSNAGGSKINSALSRKISSSQGAGGDLDGGTRSFMQSRFGADFSSVKIHTDGEAVQMNRDLSAKAFTIGNDIYFNEGQYRPESESGKHLLAHELTHVMQQNTHVVHRQNGGDAGVPADAGVAEDAETKLGRDIIANAPDGLKLGFYDNTESYMELKANEWAKSENAIGFKGTKTAVKAGDLLFGKAISDKNEAAKSINDISAIAKTCVEKAAPLVGATVGEQYKVKSVAFFAHGTEGWCSISPVSGNAGKQLVKDVAANLKSDVDVIIYACSVAGSDDDWYTGTLDTGGKGSMAEGVRDQLYDSNIRGGKVWGHTTVGDVVSNFALRYFSSANKGVGGQSYVSEYVFTPYDEYLIREAVLAALNADGYDTTTLDTAKLREYQFKNLRMHFYKAYSEANATKKYNGRNLAEAAPNHPEEVAKVINDYWNDTYWGKIKDAYIKGIIKHFKLVKK